MNIISISGLDGSGKSTQIQFLKEYLETTGKKVFYFHAVHFSIANILSKKHHHCEEYSDSQVTRQSQKEEKKTEQDCIVAPPRNDDQNVINASLIKIQLRKVALFIDIFRFNSLVKKLEKDGYDYILTDRYFYDMIVNIAYLSKKRYMPFFASWITVPDDKFYLCTDLGNIMNRDDAPTQGQEYLKDKYALFTQYKIDFKLKEIDGNRSKKEIFNTLTQHIQ